MNVVVVKRNRSAGLVINKLDNYCTKRIIRISKYRNYPVVFIRINATVCVRHFIEYKNSAYPILRLIKQEPGVCRILQIYLICVCKIELRRINVSSYGLNNTRHGRSLCFNIKNGSSVCSRYIIERRVNFVCRISKVCRASLSCFPHFNV